MCENIMGSKSAKKIWDKIEFSCEEIIWTLITVKGKICGMGLISPKIQS